MFELKGYKTNLQGLHTIESNKYVLFNDGENDILYSGSNKYGNRILGSIIFEDDDNNFLRYIHAIITDYQYYDFLNKKISLLNIIEEAQDFFLVDFNHNHEELNHALVSLNDIPTEFRPLENSYCPQFIKNPSLDYMISLKGNSSDLHKVTPTDLNSVNTKISQFLENSTKFINELELTRHLYIEAMPIGSFRIKFNIEINKSKQTDLFPAPINQIENYLSDYFKYIFNNLPYEDTNVFKQDKINSNELKVLEEKLAKIYESKNIKLSSTTGSKVVDLINTSVNSLTELDYSKSYNRIEVINYSKTGKEIPVGLVDKKFISLVEDKLEKSVISEIDIAIPEFDKTPQEYKIQVYKFSTHTGRGEAYVKISEDELDEVLIHVTGQENYEHTIFTKSMDAGKIITVTGIAEKINGNIKRITIPT